MKCDGFQELLDELLDRREVLGDNEQIREHASKCEPCRLTLRAHAVLLEAVQRKARPASRWSKTRNLTMPLAAAVLIGCLLAWQALVQPSPRINNQLSPGPTALAVHHDDGSELAQSNLESSSPPLVAARSVSAMHPVVSLQLISRADWSETLSAVPVPFVPTWEVPALETRWIETLTEQMAPVQDSMSSTFRVLRRTLPASGKSSPVNS